MAINRAAWASALSAAPVCFILGTQAFLLEHTFQGICMTITLIPGDSPSTAVAPLQPQRALAMRAADGTGSAHWRQLEANLARIVGSRGAQALLARARHLCGGRVASRVVQTRTLMQLVSKLLGESLAACLLQSKSPQRRESTTRSRLR
jgi:hypothetical protein